MWHDVNKDKTGFFYHLLFALIDRVDRLPDGLLSPVDALVQELTSTASGSVFAVGGGCNCDDCTGTGGGILLSIFCSCSDLTLPPFSILLFSASSPGPGMCLPLAARDLV